MKIVFVVSFKGFQDQEYFESRRVIEEAGHQVVVTSTELGLASGADGSQIKIEKTLNQVDLKEYQALVFIGGPGALKYLDRNDSYKLIGQAVNQKIILGAICIAPLILAHSGYFKGGQMTIWTSPMNRWPINDLRSAGVEYVARPVVQDGLLITADGPLAAIDFGQTIAASLDKI